MKVLKKEFMRDRQHLVDSHANIVKNDNYGNCQPKSSIFVIRIETPCDGTVLPPLSQQENLPLCDLCHHGSNGGRAKIILPRV